MRTIAAASDADRFGDLTDDLLWHVLSFLPSDDALQTCVLDTRWRDLWRRTTSLHFNVDDCERFRRLVKLIINSAGSHLSPSAT
ncbi:F-box protein At1g19070-like [Aegilops tauschii subsp. strangulata]|uniref:F-box protein At1g19070-like n=1 Tax=Aegilops tauschii subsp. strangulata TaxID=200361 RepID=UPI001ABD0CD7|nr:F-box protein At1g19070-like [Aegilops tauschii subsp. strangulata]